VPGGVLNGGSNIMDGCDREVDIALHSPTVRFQGDVSNTWSGVQSALQYTVAGGVIATDRERHSLVHVLAPCDTPHGSGSFLAQEKLQPAFASGLPRTTVGRTFCVFQTSGVSLAKVVLVLSSS